MSFKDSTSVAFHSRDEIEAGIKVWGMRWPLWLMCPAETVRTRFCWNGQQEKCQKNVDRTFFVVGRGMLSFPGWHKLKLCCLCALLFPFPPPGLLSHVWKMSPFREWDNERQGLLRSPPDLKLPLGH